MNREFVIEYMYQLFKILRGIAAVLLSIVVLFFLAMIAIFLITKYTLWFFGSAILLVILIGAYENTESALWNKPHLNAENEND